jgi:hypothetical protein
MRTPKKKVCNFVGGVSSPILANIYLHELDCFVETLIQSFTKGEKRRWNPEYATIMVKANGINRKIKKAGDPEKRALLIEEKRTLQERMHELPSTDQHDPLIIP